MLKLLGLFIVMGAVGAMDLSATNQEFLQGLSIAILGLVITMIGVRYE